MSNNEKSYQDQVNAQVAQYASIIDMHARPPVADWLYNTYTKPRLNLVFGYSYLTEIYARHLSDAAQRTCIDQVVSLGAGYGSLEISIMTWVRSHGLPSFRMVCTDLSPILVERMNKSIADAGLSDCMSAQISDLNQPFNIEGPVAGVMVHHALHHFVELEHIFSQIDALLHPEGIFMTEDMIGRNGHMRWPEALGLVHELWAGLPEHYRYNHIQQKYSPHYQNWDCSIEGFEGIRAQDILPELLSRFRFERFFAHLVLTDVFASTAYGPNFSIDRPQDKDFLIKILNLEDSLIDQGILKPVQMFAIMRTLRSASCPAQPIVYRGRTPDRCVRPIDKTFPSSIPTLAESRFDNPYARDVTLPPLILIPSGETIFFGAGQVGALLTRSGWEDPEEHFTWAWGIASNIAFQTRDTINFITLHVIPCFIPRIECQTISIALNGESVAEIGFEEDAAIEVSLPLLKPLGSRREVQIEFSRNRPRRPDLDPGGEMRPLSFALISMRLG